MSKTIITVSGLRLVSTDDPFVDAEIVNPRGMKPCGRNSGFLDPKRDAKIKDWIEENRLTAGRKAS